MTSPSDPEVTGRLTVYHDGACPLCRLEIDAYRRRVGSEALDFVDVSRPGSDCGNGLDRTAAMARFHVRAPDGTLSSGAAAFVAIWARLPALRRLAAVARVPGVMTALELGYRLSLPARPLLARLVAKRRDIKRRGR